tara:strand:+ start:1066 stop:1401 length:336 start_codon:yes stop_codon:yes gene_type:complete
MLDRIFETISKFFKLIIFGLIIVGLVYIGITVYANLRGDPELYKLPSISKAQYEFTIYNTNNIIYTNEYEQDGTSYTLHGYYELIDDRYKRRDLDIVLDEAIFGTITVRRR